MIEGGISKSRHIARGGPTRLQIIANPASATLSGDQCPVCGNARYHGAFRTHPRCADIATALARGAQVDEVLTRYTFSPKGAARIKAFAAQRHAPASIIQLVGSR